MRKGGKLLWGERWGFGGKSWLSLKLSSGRWRSFSLSRLHLFLFSSDSRSPPFTLYLCLYIRIYRVGIYIGTCAHDMPIMRDGTYPLPMGQTINLRVRTLWSIPVSIHLRLIKSPSNLGSPSVSSFRASIFRFASFARKQGITSTLALHLHR